MLRRDRSIAAHEIGGFTLIELIVVMTIIAIMTAAVIPIYQGSITRVTRDRAVRDFVAYLKYAQERAVTDATEYRFYFREKDGAYWIMRLDKNDNGKKEFAYLDEGVVETKYLPPAVTFDSVKARSDHGMNARYVAFYGGGACDFATITLKVDGDHQIVLETKGRLGQFEVKEK